MNIRVLRSARRSVADGIRFYERQEAGLGAYFLNSIMSDLRSLKIYGKRFPYSIYLKQEMEILVYAVLDDRRDPKWVSRTLNSIGLDE